MVTVNVPRRKCSNKAGYGIRGARMVRPQFAAGKGGGGGGRTWEEVALGRLELAVLALEGFHVLAELLDVRVAAVQRRLRLAVLQLLALLDLPPLLLHRLREVTPTAVKPPRGEGKPPPAGSGRDRRRGRVAAATTNAHGGKRGRLGSAGARAFDPTGDWVLRPG
eukprot:1065286-Prorocentrum_minimum.AAC.1